MVILIMTCSKSAKWLVDLGLRSVGLNNFLDVCLCKLRLVDLNNYLDGLWLAKIKATHDTFLSLKKVKKRVYGNYGSIFACDLEKCPRSLYMSLLRNHLFST